MRPMERRNSTDPRQKREIERRNRDQRRLELKDLAELLQLPAFRRVMHRVLLECKLWQRDGFMQSGSAMYFYSGRRDLGLWIVDELDAADAKMAVLMMEEAKRADKERLERLEREALYGTEEESEAEAETD